MIIRKFQAGTETEAIMLAKEELGRDAIVMNIKTVKPKGLYKLFRKPTVEITAAIDDNSNYQSERKLSKIQEIQKSTILEMDEGKREIKENVIEERLNNLQSLLEKQMKIKEDEIPLPTKPDTESKNIVYIQLIYNQLLNNEVDEKYANQIVNEIEKTLKKDATVDNILAAVYQKIILKLGQPKLIESVEDQTRYIFFIGPTGVGKTTTIAKIASGLKINNKAKIALVTSDTYRIAAVDQIRTYANILGIPLKVVYTEEDMKEVKEEYGNYEIVLIDTAGRSHRNRQQRDDIEKLINTIPEEEREIYLVLSATTKYKDLIKIVELYSEITKYNLIFTKLDETNYLGNIFNLKMLTNASLSYAAWGQNVPDDFGKIDTQSIAKQLLGGND